MLLQFIAIFLHAAICISSNDVMVQYKHIMHSQLGELPKIETKQSKTKNNYNIPALVFIQETLNLDWFQIY